MTTVKRRLAIMGEYPITMLFFFALLGWAFVPNAVPASVGESAGRSGESALQEPPLLLAAQEAANPPSAPGSTPNPAASPGDNAAAMEAAREKVQQELLKKNFSYVPTNLPDPFAPFITPQEAQPEASMSDESEGAPEPRRPLTPLQKMTVAEIEKGLKAITWGGLGRRAVIEDSAGKGYIVEVGTLAGDRNGVITEIFNDRIVLQQEIWDRKLKQTVPQNFVIKLKKVAEK